MIIESFNRVKVREDKEKFIALDFLAQRITEYVGASLSKDANVRPLYDAVNLFEEEKELEEKARIEKELELSKIRMMEFMDFHNRKFRKEEEQ